MKRSHRVSLAALVTMTLAACSVDPMSPTSPNARASLLLVGATDAPTSVTGTQVSASSVCGVLSGTSTYIVAYGELLPVCTTPPSDSVLATPTVRPDSLTLKLSFE
jgi:hypothetical protein